MLINEVLPNLYRIEVPLPQNPLKYINSYIVKGEERTLIIDTGLDRAECMNAMSSSLMELGVDLQKTDFFITHMHADHMGLVPKLTTSTSSIYCSKLDAAIINTDDRFAGSRIFARMGGFSDQEFQAATKKFPLSPGRLEFDIVGEGDSIKIGEFVFSCVETPGHTKGHMCLFEANNKILVSGDHLLSEITPNISTWYHEEDPLKHFFSSLDKISNFDVELVLPGHRAIFSNCSERAEEIKLHHQMRLIEILAILEKGSKDPFEVAAQMTWAVTHKSWEEFPVQQKIFASGEALAHLSFLEGTGKVQKQMIDDKIIFSL